MAKTMLATLVGLLAIVLGLYNLLVPSFWVSLGWISRWTMPGILWILGVVCLLVGFLIYRETRDHEKFMREYKL